MGLSSRLASAGSGSSLKPAADENKRFVSDQAAQRLGTT
jgi:hypothetical protein